MSTTLTLKTIPDELYERLKTSAEVHRRSVNNEAIACLEAVLLPGRMATSERLDRARFLRTQLAPERFHARDIELFKHEGSAPHTPW